MDSKVLKILNSYYATDELIFHLQKDIYNKKKNITGRKKLSKIKNVQSDYDFSFPAAPWSYYQRKEQYYKDKVSKYSEVNTKKLITR